jgi:hypothetical protein
MGNTSSNEGGDGGGHDDDPYDPFDGADTLGYRVLGVQPNSPASRAGLVSFLDFLVGANQQMLLGSGQDLEDGEEYDDVDLPALLEENKDKPIEFRTFIHCVPGHCCYAQISWARCRGARFVPPRLLSVLPYDSHLVVSCVFSMSSPVHLGGGVFF